MPLYFIDITADETTMEDDEGMEFASRQAAYEACASILLDVAHMKFSHGVHKFKATVCDQHRERLFTRELLLTCHVV